MKVVAAILAAGRGERFGGDKTLVLLGNRPIWRWSFDAFASHPEIDAVGLVGSKANLSFLSSEKGALFAIEGGATRRESSLKALEACPLDTEIVLLHDAARPFVSRRIISDVIAGVRRSRAAAPGILISDTVKQLSGGSLRTIDRSNLFTVQTPQGARREDLKDAHQKATSEVTDDLGLLEAIGIVPEIIPGDPENIKITTPEDIARWGASRGISEVRTGIGYDVHAFSSDPHRPLMLGGVRFEGVKGLEGHSDADALLHAAVDALLGAAALGDIGCHFPDTDPKWKNAPSIDFLRYAGHLLKEGGWSVQNLDVTVIAEHPKLSSHADSIRRNIASALDIELGRVSVKATTNERLGFIGRGEGIAAFATATISKK